MTSTKQGRIKVFGRFVHPVDDFYCSCWGWTIWRRGTVCVARETEQSGREGRCQISEHGCGRKSFQVFDENGNILADVDTRY